MTIMSYICILTKQIQMFKDIDIRLVDKEITPFEGLPLFFKKLKKRNFNQKSQK